MMPAGFAQTNLGAIAFRCEITLLDRATVKMPQIRRQSLDQKFPFDFARDFAVVGEPSPHGSSLCSNLFMSGKLNIHKNTAHSVIPSEARDLSIGHHLHKLGY